MEKLNQAVVKHYQVYSTQAYQTRQNGGQSVSKALEKCKTRTLTYSLSVRSRVEQPRAAVVRLLGERKTGEER